MALEQGELGGMTVNERFSTVGLLRQWDDAMRSRDRHSAIDLLGRVDMADQAEWIVDTIFANPERYGFPNDVKRTS